MKANRQTRRDARKLFRMCFENHEMDSTRVREVARGITDAKHRGHFQLLCEFHRLVKLEDSRRTAEIASATPLATDLRNRITANLQHLYGLGLQMRFVEKPELIGGVRVLVGSDVYDDTVSYRLAQLEKVLSATYRW